ncbi:MAG: hypothetical protein HY514_01625 [Candidatus Aenigmarchaeota archaeon]|nr:hypothetical protein [Candidatus Aenigmarchaeota archaeon]
MGIMTISVNDEAEKLFRKLASAKYGKRKGALGEAVEEAIGLWAEKEKKNAVAKAMELLEKGHNSGGLLYKSRDELHER